MEISAEKTKLMTNGANGIKKEIMVKRQMLGTVRVGRKSQKLTQLSSRSHPRHLVGKRTAQKTPS